MTVVPAMLTSTATDIDLRSSSTAIYQNPAPYSNTGRKTVGTQQTLWSGDVNKADGVPHGGVKYTGSGNDRDFILLFYGGNPPNKTYSFYNQYDVNLDAWIKYTGVNNDRDRILLNVGSTTPNNVVYEQMPEGAL